MMAWLDLPETVRRPLETVCTPGELEAVKLAAAGLNDREIADRQRITPQAVRKRIDRAYHKAKRHPDWRLPA